MDQIVKGDTWTLPSKRDVVVVTPGLWDVELRYVDTKHGEVFFVQRVWLIKHGKRCEVVTPKDDLPGNVKFTHEEVRLVMDLVDAGLSYEQIVARWDAGKPISKSSVAHIAQGGRSAYRE